MRKIALAIAICVVIATPALAHDWIGKEHRANAQGQLCCGERSVSPDGTEKGDCYKYTSREVKATAKGWRFPDGRTIPYNIAAPSKDGFFWICISYDNTPRCVFAPASGS